MIVIVAGTAENLAVKLFVGLFAAEQTVAELFFVSEVVVAVMLAALVLKGLAWDTHPVQQQLLQLAAEQLFAAMIAAVEIVAVEIVAQLLVAVMLVPFGMAVAAVVAVVAVVAAVVAVVVAVV